MIILQDTREKIGKHSNVLTFFSKNNIKVIRQKLDVGDYRIVGVDSVAIDLKQNVLELAYDLFQDKIRFQKECQRAKMSGVKLIFLIEEKIESKEEMFNWKSKSNVKGKRFTIVSGRTIYNEIVKYSTLYGCVFKFCHKNSTGKKIIELIKQYGK